MKPYSRVIQLVLHNPNYDEQAYIALCADGSIWFYYPSLAETNPWELLSEMDNGRYVTAWKVSDENEQT